MKHGNIREYICAHPECCRAALVSSYTVFCLTNYWLSEQIQDICSGLVYLHSFNIIHGDLKAVSYKCMIPVIFCMVYSSHSSMCLSTIPNMRSFVILDSPVLKILLSPVHVLCRVQLLMLAEASTGYLQNVCLVNRRGARPISTLLGWLYSKWVKPSTAVKYFSECWYFCCNRF